MTLPPSAALGPPIATGALVAPTVAALATALRDEGRLLADLADVLQRQRESIALDDLEGLDDAVFSTHRVLVTLGEARRRRQALNRMMGEADDLSMESVAETFGGTPPGDVQTAIESLQAIGARLHREIDLNHRVLEAALTAGDQLVRALCGAVPAASATYGPDAARSNSASMLDRRI